MIRALALLALGAALVALAATAWPAQLPHAWLAAALTFLAWPLGCIALLLIHAVTGGRWGEAARLPLWLGTATLPLALIAFVPLAFGLSDLYPWTHPGTALPNGFYLNLPFATGRVAAYVVIWLALAVLALLRPPPLAPLGLILLALTASFATIDAALSLDPSFASSVFPMLAGTGMVLFALSLTLLLAVPMADRRARGDLGKLLLALCLLWAYLDFVQFLVIWSSNLESDTGWIRRRVDGAWGWIGGAEALLHGVLPLFVLAIPRLRRVDAAVMTLAAALAVSGAVRSWWLVLPEAGRAPGLADFCCMAGLALLAAGLAALLLQPMRRRAARQEAAHA